MKLIVQPDDGLTPVLQAIKRAKKSIQLAIFRLDREEVQKALGAAVARGVVVRALIAHTNHGGAKRLRKLEQQLLEAGITVARTADDLPRYHGKVMLVDDALYVLGFNYTKLDIEKSRSFGLVTGHRALVKDANTLFEADSTRQPFTPSHKRFVVSPENARKVLSAFIHGAKKELLLYDEKVSDKLMLRQLQARIEAGVAIRIIGKITKPMEGAEVRKAVDIRLHLRAIVRDGSQAFVGSQSLRKIELDGRREVGLIATDARIARKIKAVFESDWADAVPKKEQKAPEDTKDQNDGGKKKADKNSRKNGEASATAAGAA